MLWESVLYHSVEIHIRIKKYQRNIIWQVRTEKFYNIVNREFINEREYFLKFNLLCVKDHMKLMENKIWQTIFYDFLDSTKEKSCLD